MACDWSIGSEGGGLGVGCNEGGGTGTYGGLSLY